MGNCHASTRASNKPRALQRRLRRRRRDAELAQMAEQRRQRLDRQVVGVALLAAGGQERRHHRRLKPGGRVEPLAAQPAAQVRHQLQLEARRHRRVAEPRQLRDEAVRERCHRAAHSRPRRVLHDRLPLSDSGRRKEEPRPIRPRYADLASASPATDNGLRDQVGITRRSA